MKIYEELLQDAVRLEIEEDIFDSTQKLQRFLKDLDIFVEYHFEEEIRENMKKAILQYCRQGNDYLIHKFQGYYAISKIIDDFCPREISNEIQVLDKDRIYPLQEIEIKLDFKYNY